MKQSPGSGCPFFVKVWAALTTHPATMLSVRGVGQLWQCEQPIIGVLSFYTSLSFLYFSLSLPVLLAMREKVCERKRLCMYTCQCLHQWTTPRQTHVSGSFPLKSKSTPPPCPRPPTTRSTAFRRWEKTIDWFDLVVRSPKTGWKLRKAREFRWRCKGDVDGTKCIHVATNTFIHCTCPHSTNEFFNTIPHFGREWTKSIDARYLQQYWENIFWLIVGGHGDLNTSEVRRCVTGIRLPAVCDVATQTMTWSPTAGGPLFGDLHTSSCGLRRCLGLWIISTSFFILSVCVCVWFLFTTDWEGFIQVSFAFVCQDKRTMNRIICTNPSACRARYLTTVCVCVFSLIMSWLELVSDPLEHSN